MIIPRTPSPEPLEEKDELTREEIKELQRQKKEFKAKMDTPLTKLKRERAEGRDDRANKRVRNLPRNGDVLLAVDESGVRPASTAGLPARQQEESITITSDTDSD